MKINELVDKLGLNALNSLTGNEINDVLITDIVSDVVKYANTGTLVITAQPHSTLISAAKLGDVSAIVYTLGRKPQDKVIGLAEEAHISLLNTDQGTFELAGKLVDLGL